MGLRSELGVLWGLGRAIRDRPAFVGYGGTTHPQGDEGAQFEIVRRSSATGEPRTLITLYQAVLKGERFGWALQKGTEVGISRFVPVVCERSVVDDLGSVEQKRERWERIIQEAAEQSGRARLPVLAPAQILETVMQVGSSGSTAPGPLRLMLWEQEGATTLRQALAGCNFAIGARIEVLVGPEGGYTAAEVGLAEHWGARRVTLGPRILRAETAGVVAAAAILYEAGEM